MANSPADSWNRVRQSFADQFEQGGTGFIYRQSQKGEAIRVSAEERSKFLDQFDRHVRRAKWIMYIGLTIVLGGIVLLSVARGADLSQGVIFIGIGVAIIPYFVYYAWAWRAPVRELAGRTPVGGERPAEEVRRLRFRRMTYGQLASAAGAGLAVPFILRSRGDIFSGGNRLWLVVGAAFVLLAGVQAFRKWRFEQDDECTNVISRPFSGITEPSEDSANSRSKSQLRRYVPIALIVAAIAFIFFTPAGEQFARTPSFWPIVMIGCGAWSLSTVVRGFVKGEAEPFARGFHNTYERDAQPKRFWASMTWNALFGGLCLWLAFEFREQSSADACYGRSNNSPQEVVSACSELIAKGRNSKDDLAAALVVRGVAYQRLHNDRHAIADYTESIRMKPNEAGTYYDRALTYQELGDAQLAISDYSSAISLQPSFAEAFLHRGTAYQSTGNLRKAIEDFNEAVRLAPDQSDGYYYRGWARWSLGDEESAKADFKVATRIDPALKTPIRSGD